MIDWSTTLPTATSFKESIYKDKIIKALTQAEKDGKICRCPTEKELARIIYAHNICWDCGNTCARAILKLLKGGG